MSTVEKKKKLVNSFPLLKEKQNTNFNINYIIKQLLSHCSIELVLEVVLRIYSENIIVCFALFFCFHTTKNFIDVQFPLFQRGKTYIPNPAKLIALLLLLPVVDNVSQNGKVSFLALTVRPLTPIILYNFFPHIFFTFIPHLDFFLVIHSHHLICN